MIAPCAFLAEKYVAHNPEKVLFSFLLLNVLASGRVAFIVAVAVSVLVVAVAWRL